MVDFEFIHDFTTVLALTGFLALIIVYAVIWIKDGHHSPSGVLAIGLSGMLRKSRGLIYLAVFEASLVLLLAAMLYKYVYDMHLAYDILEIFTEILFISSLSALLLSYLQHRKTIVSHSEA